MEKNRLVALAAGAVAGLPLGIYMTVLGMMAELAYPGQAFLSLLMDMPVILIVGLLAGLLLPIGACIGALVGVLFIRVSKMLDVLPPLLASTLYRKAIVFAVILWVLSVMAWRVLFHGIGVGVWIFALIMFAFEGVMFVALFDRWIK